MVPDRLEKAKKLRKVGEALQNVGNVVEVLDDMVGGPGLVDHLRGQEGGEGVAGGEGPLRGALKKIRDRFKR